MRRFAVTIHENLKRTIVVEADSAVEAEVLVADRWRNGEYILDAEDFTDVDFETSEVRKKDERER